MLVISTNIPIIISEIPKFFLSFLTKLIPTTEINNGNIYLATNNNADTIKNSTVSMLSFIQNLLLFVL